MTNQDIQFDELAGVDGDVGVIILQRPQALNALTQHMCVQIKQHLDQWAQQKNIKAVVIKGEGERAFCAGGDVRYVYQQGRDNIAASRQFFWHEYRMNRTLFHFPKPFIALLHGIVMGGGAGVSLHGSHPVAGDTTHFAMPETAIGFFPDVGMSYLLARCQDAMGFYLGLTGANINSSDMLYLGLVKHSVASKDFAHIIDDLVAASFGNNAMETVSDVISHYQIIPHDAELHKKSTLIANGFGADSFDALIANLKNSDDAWAQENYKALQGKSPASVRVTWLAIQQAKQLSFDDCMRMEFNLTQHFLTQADFYEGVRAALVDKDQQPQWQPAPSAEQVATYFDMAGHRELTFD